MNRRLNGRKLTQGALGGLEEGLAVMALATCATRTAWTLEVALQVEAAGPCCPSVRTSHGGRNFVHTNHPAAAQKKAHSPSLGLNCATLIHLPFTIINHYYPLLPL